MQQQQQQPASMSPFSPAGGGTTPVVSQHAQPSPISSRPPEGQQRMDGEPAGAGGSSAPPAGGGFDHEGMSGGGDEGERGGSAGNRWPRQETLALLKIRSEMDAAFREAALKGPLWEDVSRKLAAMGYKRSAKKCREKFENVDKYYKRTKDGRAGRGDGKAYRFFSELEALHGASGASSSPQVSLAPTPVAMAPPPAPFPQLGVHTVMHAEAPPVLSTMPPTVLPASAPAAATTPCMVTPADLSFSSSSDGEDTDETGDVDGGKRKRRDGGGGSSKMMRFFEGLMRQVMERQEEMQQRFIEAIERREQDRMIREEAWRRQEVARLAREQDALAQERAMAASRDAAVVSFIQRITGQTIPMPPPPPPSSSVPASVAPPPPAMFSALTHQQQHQPLKPMPVASAAPATLAPKPQPTVVAPTTMTTQSQSTESKVDAVVRAPASEMDTMTGGAPSPSRWPKAEVHALIQLRTELEARYQDSGPKGPLWEDISSGMRRLGYNRSAKRCKEKWENINKYFKKVKESNKKRPEDSKTCPYYHQLEALYRSKALAASSSPHPPPPPRPADTVLAAVPLSQTAPAPPPQDVHRNNGNGCASPGTGNGVSSGGMQTHTQQGTNGGVAATRFPVEGGNGTTPVNNQQEDIIMKETPMAEETTPQPVSMNDSYVNDRMDAGDSDSMDDDDEDDFDDDDDDVGGGNSNGNKMQYEIQFQRQQQQQSQTSVVRPNATAGAGSAGPGPATTTGSFLTMVHH